MTDVRVSFPTPCSERWEDMRPAGCNRHCAACNKVIHDLSAMTLDEVESLIRNEPELCVRARVKTNGIVDLKTSVGSARRMIAAMGASMSLAVAACQTASPMGSIAGWVELGEEPGRPTVRARDVDGRIFRAEVSRDGTYEIPSLPPGTYTLTFSEPYCSAHLKKIEDVEVKLTRVELAKIDWSRSCDAIIIGMIEIEDHTGQSGSM